METSTLIWIAVAIGVIFLVYQESQKKSTPKSSAKKSAGVVRKKGRKTSKSDLKKLTKNQLVELANKKNLKVKVSGKKADVINEIHDQLDEEDDSDENADL